MIGRTLGISLGLLLAASASVAQEDLRAAARQTITDAQVQLTSLQTNTGSYKASAETALASAAKLSAQVALTLPLMQEVGCGRDTRLAEAMKTLADANASFDAQYLAMQQKMDEYSRMVTILSNMMKTQTETAKSIIDNMK